MHNFISPVKSWGLIGMDGDASLEVVLLESCWLLLGGECHFSRMGREKQSASRRRGGLTSKLGSGLLIGERHSMNIDDWLFPR
jgi:hypothetical protein